MNTPIKFSLLASPHLLTKRIDLVDGHLVKTPAANTVTGVKRMACNTLTEVMTVLDSLSEKHAACWGVSVAEADESVVETAERVENGQAVAGAISRTRKFMTWANAAGVFMADLDDDHTPESARTALIAAWRAVFTESAIADELEKVEMFYRPSASAGVHAKGCPPLQGGRLYFAVEHAEDIPRIGEALVAGLWLNGHGVVKPSKSGAALLRCPVDDSVWQPERIDFVSPAFLGDGLLCERPSSVRFGEHGYVLPAFDVIISPAVEAEVQALQTKARDDAKPMLDNAFAGCVEKHAEKFRAKCIAHGVTDEEQITVAIAESVNGLQNARAYHTLDVGFRLYLSKDLSKSVTVAEILREPAKFHGIKCCDPLEPEDTLGKARIYTNNAPVVHSFAHGGAKYRLVSQARKVVPYIPANQIAEYVRLTISSLREAFPGQLYRYGDALVYVTAQGKLREMNLNTLVLFASDALDFMRPHPKKKDFVAGPLTDRVAAQIIGNVKDAAYVHLPEILNVSNGPFLSPKTGEIVDGYGYDGRTKVYLHSDGDFPPMTPIHSKEEAIRIARRLVAPYADFEFYNPSGHANHHDALVLLLVLMVTVRPTVVGFVLLITAVRAGAGKTYLMRSLLAEIGEKLVVTNWNMNDDESTKILATHIKKHLPFLCIDNFDHPIGGPLEVFADKEAHELGEIRLLGKNEAMHVPNNFITMATGINLRSRNEAMARRSLDVTLTGEVAWAGKKMQFPVAPAEYIINNWRERKMLALSLVRWGHEQRFKAVEPVLNSLPDFDRYVRRLVHDLFGIDLFSHVLDTVKEVGAQNDVQSPKGMLLYYAWEMYRAHARSGYVSTFPDRIKTGEMQFLQANEEQHEDALLMARTEAMPGWLGQGAGKPVTFKFKVDHLKRFISHNVLDERGMLGEVMKSMKSADAWGVFNGMRFEKTGEKDNSDRSIYMLHGAPLMMPEVMRFPKKAIY